MMNTFDAPTTLESKYSTNVVVYHSIILIHGESMFCVPLHRAKFFQLLYEFFKINF